MRFFINEMLSYKCTPWEWGQTYMTLNIICRLIDWFKVDISGDHRVILDDKDREFESRVN